MIGDPPYPPKGGFAIHLFAGMKPPFRGVWGVWGVRGLWGVRGSVGGPWVCGSFYNLCITSPERSFGSNHVALGGMILPESAMSIICCIDTG